MDTWARRGRRSAATTLASTTPTSVAGDDSATRQRHRESDVSFSSNHEHSGTSGSIDAESSRRATASSRRAERRANRLEPRVESSRAASMWPGAVEQAGRRGRLKNTRLRRLSRRVGVSGINSKQPTISELIA